MVVICQKRYDLDTSPKVGQFKVNQSQKINIWFYSCGLFCIILFSFPLIVLLASFKQTRYPVDWEFSLPLQAESSQELADKEAIIAALEAEKTELRSELKNVTDNGEVAKQNRDDLQKR